MCCNTLVNVKETSGLLEQLHRAHTQQGKSSQCLAEDILALNEIQFKTMTTLVTGHGCIRKYLHKTRDSKCKLVYKPYNEEKETAYLL